MNISQRRIERDRQDRIASKTEQQRRNNKARKEIEDIREVEAIAMNDQAYFEQLWKEIA